MEFILPERRERPRRGPLGRLARFAAKAAWQRIAPGVDAAGLRDAFTHLLGEGFVEPASGRYLIDYGHYAEMFVDGQRFSGRSGQPLQPRYRERREPEQPYDPLTLLKLMYQATGARYAGDEAVRETMCRVVTVQAGSSEFTVWIDDEYIRRIQSEVYGLPVVRVNREEGPAFGAALLAAVGVGAFADLAAAARATLKRLPPERPRPEAHRAYEEPYRRFQALYAALNASS